MESNTEIEIREGVEASVQGSTLRCKGKSGEVAREIADPRLKVEVKEGKIILSALKSTKREKKILNSYSGGIA